MPTVAEPLRPARVLAKPKKYAPLRSFSAGRQGNRWEKIVNEWARSVYLGTQVDPQTVVVVEDARGQLIGVCSFRPRALSRAELLLARMPKPAGVPHYIHMLGVDRLYHGQRLQDGSRLGDVLMLGALAQIEQACGGRMPAVWALVTPENERARALFARHGFQAAPYVGEGEVMYMRDPGRARSLLPGKLLGRWRVRGRSDAASAAGVATAEDGATRPRPA